MSLLEWLAKLPGRGMAAARAGALDAAARARSASRWLLLPRGFPARWLGALLLLPMFAVPPPGPGPGELWVTVLDVGQGLAVVARTENHALLYDAGPAFNASADSGSRVIVPYLRGEGVGAARRAGGLARRQRPRGRRRLGARCDAGRDALGVAARGACAARGADLASAVSRRKRLELGRRGVRLPASARSAARGTADPGEQPQLRAAHRFTAAAACCSPATSSAPPSANCCSARRRLLAADALLVPHHGSASSSTAEFVRQVAPRWAVFAVGYRNRFGHPREEVLARYRDAGSALLRTDSRRRGADAFSRRRRRGPRRARACAALLAGPLIYSPAETRVNLNATVVVKGDPALLREYRREVNGRLEEEGALAYPRAARRAQLEYEFRLKGGHSVPAVRRVVARFPRPGRRGRLERVRSPAAAAARSSRTACCASSRSRSHAEGGERSAGGARGEPTAGCELALVCARWRDAWLGYVIGAGSTLSSGSTGSANPPAL